MANGGLPPTSLATPQLPGISKQGNMNKRIRPVDGIVRVFFFLCGIVSIFTTIGFTYVLGIEAFNFFATTEWLGTNRALVQAVDAEQTQLIVPSSGSAVNVGDIVRIGITDANEIVQILGVEPSETDAGQTILTVQRGVNGTRADAHAANQPLFRGAEVTMLKFITETRWAPQIGNFGILPLLTSTIMTSLIGMLVATPIGLGAAIYLSEYASRRVRGYIKPAIEVLAGIPSVVYGYFALTFVTPLLRAAFGTDVVQVYNMASAGLVIGILIVPTIASISEDALQSVPNALREASYGLGATKFETVVQVLLPAALSGISAALILAVSRAVGETMIVLIAAGAGPNFTFNPFENAETMAGHIARISTGDISRGTIDYNSVFAVGATLFVATLLLNLISTYITQRFRERY